MRPIGFIPANPYQRKLAAANNENGEAPTGEREKELHERTLSTFDKLIEREESIEAAQKQAQVDRNLLELQLEDNST